MSSRSMQHIRCVSHGCEMWNGPALADADIRALQGAHSLIHYNRPITPADLGFGTDPESSE